MHRPVKVAHSSFIEGSHMTKNTASAYMPRTTLTKKRNFNMICTWSSSPEKDGSTSDQERGEETARSTC
jgi:hypothetical protein